MKKMLLLSLLTLFIFSCNDKDDGDKTIIMVVASERIEFPEGEWVLYPYGYYVKFNKGDAWEVISNLVGFNFEEGYECEIVVKVTHPAPVMQDVPSKLYQYEKTLSKIARDSEGLPN